MSATLDRPRDIAETLRIATPLAAAQLTQMAMGVTDTVLLGGLGGDALAAGGLAANVYFSVVLMLQGVLTGASILIAQEHGAGRDAPRVYWAGLGMAALLMGPAFVLFSYGEPLLLFVGEPPRLAAETGAYLHVLRWAVPGSMLGMGLMRAVLPAIGQGADLLWVALGSAALNFVLCWGLIYGRWGLPELGFLGPAVATTLVGLVSSGTLLALLHGRARLRRYVLWQVPRWAEFAAIARLGVPVAGIYLVENGLFLAVGLLLGVLGAEALAAQQVAMSVISVSFMVPLAIAQAANVRVGNRVGAGDRAGARRAGFVAIGLGAAAEVVCALAILATPATVAGWYLDPAELGANRLAISLLGVAAAFQVLDGVQSVANGALRGLGDTRVPFLMAALGYWAIGFPLAWALALPLGFGAEGAWWGLAAGLLVVAGLLTWRFARRTA